MLTHNIEHFVNIYNFFANNHYKKARGVLYYSFKQFRSCEYIDEF